MKEPLRTLRMRLFPQPDDGKGLVTLGQRRIYILPSAAGLLYGVTLIVMYLGAMNYNLALGHALVYLMVSLALTGMLHAFRNLSGLSLAWSPPAPVFAGEAALFPVYLSHHHPYPRLALHLRLGTGPLATAKLLPNGQSVQWLKTSPLPRGCHPMPSLHLRSAYPLGLFRTWSRIFPSGEIWVYPSPLRGSLFTESIGGNGQQQTSRNGQEDFAGLRPRQPGDPLRHVAWRAAARQGGDGPLPVKQFAGGGSPQIWIDWKDLGAMALEERLSRLTGCLLDAEEAGLHYGLRVPGQEIAPSHGPYHLSRCLELLAAWPSS